MPGIRNFTLLVIVSVIWGLSFVAIRRAVGPPLFELSAVNLSLLRWYIVSLGFLAVYPFAIRPKMRFEWKDFPRLFAVAVASVVVYQLALNAAERLVNASLVGLLNSLGPVFVATLSALLLREKIRARLALGVLLAIVGAAAIFSPVLSLSSGSSISGSLLVVIANLSYAVFTVISKPLVGKYGPFPVAAWSAFLGSAILSPLVSQSLILQVEALSIGGWASVIYLSILVTLVGYSIFYFLVGRQAVSQLSAQLYLIPVVGVVGGVLILGEPLGLPTILGGILILFAVGLATRSHS